MIEVIFEFENLDATLGFQILKHKPQPYERPDVKLLLPRLKAVLGSPVAGTAILREGDGFGDVKKRKFAVVLIDAGIRVVWAETTARRRGIAISRDVVDDVTDFELRSCRASTVIAATHDYYAAQALHEQKEKGARVGILGFTEFISDRSAAIADFVLDLEYDVGVFNKPLPRLQVF
jgi:uncharacterized protein